MGQDFHKWLKIIGKSLHDWPQRSYPWHAILLFIHYMLFYDSINQARWKQTSIINFTVIIKHSLLSSVIVVSLKCVALPLIHSLDQFSKYNLQEKLSAIYIVNHFEET